MSDPISTPLPDAALSDAALGPTGALLPTTALAEEAATPMSALANGTTQLLSSAGAPKSRTPIIAGVSISFLVYPDEFAGPLAAANYISGNWPITQSHLNQLTAALESLAGGASGVLIAGDQAFRSAVIRDMAWLMTADSGRSLMEAVLNTGKTLAINKSNVPGLNDTQFESIENAQVSAGGAPGPGSNASIRYDVGKQFIGDGSEEWMRVPSPISLGHELVHAWDGMSGTLSRSVGARERRAVGLNEFVAAPFSENRFRQELGLVLRPRYQ
jgi:hypothetical protein